MSVKDNFVRLESLGRWYRTPRDAGRDVVVHLGDTSVTLISKNDVALAHWSIGGIRRLEVRGRPPRYGPDGGGPEFVEISDKTMVEALDRELSSAREPIKRTRRPIGRWIAAAAALAAVAAAAHSFPDWSSRLAASFFPPSDRAEIGEQIAGYVAAEFGGSCESRQAAAPLRKLSGRLFPGERGGIRVISGLGVPSAHLPGGLVLVDRDLVIQQDSPEVLAGHVLMERTLMALNDPLARLIREAGTGAMFGVMFRRRIPDTEMRIHAASVPYRPRAPFPEDELLDRFREAGFPSTPFALSLQGADGLSEAIAAGDPLEGGIYSPLLTDGEWLGLQAACGG